MFFRQPAPGISHAGILACCTLVDMSEEEIHDVLSGITPVPTEPEPTRLILSEAEQARGWMQHAEQVLQALYNCNAPAEEIVHGLSHIDLQADRVRFHETVEKCKLWGGRKLTFDLYHRNRYAVVDKEGALLFFVQVNLPISEMKFRLAFYDEAFAAGVEEGRHEVRRPILEALGVGELARRRWRE